MVQDISPANKDLRVLLTQNTGLLSNNSLVSAQTWSCDSCMTSLQPFIPTVCVANRFYVSVWTQTCMWVSVYQSVTANVQVLYRVPHLLLMHIAFSIGGWEAKRIIRLSSACVCFCVCVYPCVWSRIIHTNEVICGGLVDWNSFGINGEKDHTKHWQASAWMCTSITCSIDIL